MNGSQYHYHQALTMIRPSTEALRSGTLTSKKESAFFLTFLTIILLTLTLSGIAHAGPSQPRLKGGNGNSNGR